MYIVRILQLLAIIIALKYVYLILKRIHLLTKIGKQLKKHDGTIQYCRNPFASVFKHDGKTDITLQVQDKMINVSIITTPLRRIRYHFDMNSMLLELIVERRGVFVRSIKYAHFASYDHIFTITKYKIDFEPSTSNFPRYVILHPAPISISRVYGPTFTPIYNNDELRPGVKVCGLKWFIENIL